MNASCNWVNLFKSVQISSCAVNKPLPARRYRPTSAVLYLSVCLSVCHKPVLYGNGEQTELVYIIYADDDENKYQLSAIDPRDKIVV